MLQKANNVVITCDVLMCEYGKSKQTIATDLGQSLSAKETLP